MAQGIRGMYLFVWLIIFAGEAFADICNYTDASGFNSISCPQSYDLVDETYCCGDDNFKYCCKYTDTTKFINEVVAIVFGVLGFIELLAIATSITACYLFSRKKPGTIIADTEIANPLMVTTQPTPQQQPYPTMQHQQPPTAPSMSQPGATHRAEVESHEQCPLNNQRYVVAAPGICHNPAASVLTSQTTDSAAHLNSPPGSSAGTASDTIPLSEDF